MQKNRVYLLACVTATAAAFWMSLDARSARAGSSPEDEDAIPAPETVASLPAPSEDEPADAAVAEVDKASVPVSALSPSLSAPSLSPASLSEDDEKNAAVELKNTRAELKTVSTELKKAFRSLSDEERETRLSHAHELLGKYYKHSVVRSGEQVKKINGMIYRWTYRALPKKYKRKYQKVAQTVIDESYKHDFDPVFLMAVIMNESSFIPTRKGRFGEIGLMQLKPSTAQWIAKRAGVKYRGKKSLTDPVTNIKLGSAYLSYLREKFDSQARLYLAAYNMGQGNVADALERKVWPKEYPAHVMKHYIQYYAELDEKND